MPLVPTASTSTFETFVDRITALDTLELLAERTRQPVARLRDQITMAAAESAQTLRVLAGLQVDGPVLEIGAGLGVTAAYLSCCGFEVTALEPGGVGFEQNSSVSQHLADVLGWHHSRLAMGVEDLDPAVHGPFSLVYSNNVLEHVSDVAAAFRSMTSVTSVDGVQVHSCPNYSIPYEPHFGIPLVPVRPRWTSKLVPRSIGESSLWQSLNFVKARDVTALAGDLSRVVHFRSGSLAASLDRLRDDREFRTRHRAIAVIETMLRRVGAVALLRRLPATWSTPMDFLIGAVDMPDAVAANWLRRGEPS